MYKRDDISYNENRNFLTNALIQLIIRIRNLQKSPIISGKDPDETVVKIIMQIVIIGQLVDNAMQIRDICLRTARRVAMYVIHEHPIFRSQVNINFIFDLILSESLFSS